MARRKAPTTHGLAVVDKPAGVTSHDVVGMLRRRFDERQVGHAGTLDPDATGVLLVGVGKVTRLLRFLTALGKTYTGEVVLGTSTSTLDAAGEVTGTFDMSAVTAEMAKQVAAEHLTGPIMQIPPMVSAVRIDGKTTARVGPRRHRGRSPGETGNGPFVRRGRYRRPIVCCASRCTARPARTSARSLTTSVDCSVVVRHLRNLRRTAVGSFSVDEAQPPDSCELMSPLDALRDYARIDVDASTADMVRNGRVLDRFDGDGPWAVVDTGGALLAVYELFGTAAKPAVVIA